MTVLKWVVEGVGEAAKEGRVHCDIWVERDQVWFNVTSGGREGGEGCGEGGSAVSLSTRNKGDKMISQTTPLKRQLMAL